MFEKVIDLLPELIINDSMEAIKLTNKANEEVWINLSNVLFFEKRGRGTTVNYDNGTKVEVRESTTIVQYLLDHYVFDVETDEIYQ